MSRLFLLLVLCACVRARVLSVKGLYCQDPETGRLYGVNATWPSTTFCGNYTCKIRLRNQDMEHAQSRTIVNITRPDFKMENVKDFSKKDLIEAKNTANVDVKKDDIEKTSIYQKHNAMNANLHQTNTIHSKLNSINRPLQNSDDDRFLNHEEIKTISELLHTVKKSDLEAIIEIYNLAQDIYKEMDAVTTNSVVKEALEDVLEKESPKLAQSSEVRDVKNDHRSYWYDPLWTPNVLHGFQKPSADLKSEGSEYRPTSIEPYVPMIHTRQQQPQASHATRPPQTTTTTQPSYVKQPTLPTYFSGVLSNQDFGRLAYYYPVSNFQKLASFYNQRSPYDLPPTPTRIPCNTKCHKNHIPPIYRDNGRPYNPLPRPAPAVPSVLLPFPFSVQSYNTSAYPINNYNNYYKGNPWTYYDYYKNSPYPHPFIPDGQVPKNSALDSPDIVTQDNNKNLAYNDEQTVVTEKSKDDLQSWQTEPLSDAVIAEVRANIAERAKLLKIPYKKRIKMEKIAKVIKLDHLNRYKREALVKEVKIKANSAENVEELEAYIEKTTCNTSTEPGYFRIGNMSQPFPGCCPQKIDSR